MSVAVEDIAERRDPQTMPRKMRRGSADVMVPTMDLAELARVA